ncbi:MAG: methionyl-tRNA formyltransferase [Bacilli bacterium]|nr:methionyl-tRNA formyltransferase [Bacilli bacterium]MDD4808735.1 methionyl-tRNA formyltransferase [Bacilli bacterium]
MNLENINVNKKIKILYMGTPSFSEVVLRGLLKEYKIRAIVTQPDKKRDRDGQIIPSPVKKVGLENTILVLQPEDIKNDYEEVLALQPDLIITCAYGQFIPQEILDYPKYGCINVHASLLPKLRGGAPIHKAIINGYRKTGVTIMYMNREMDAGDIISQKEIEIMDDDTASTLHDKLAVLGRDLLLETIPSILNGTNQRIKQDSSEVTLALTLKREDEKLDFQKTKRQIYNQVRGLNSWPGAYCLFEGKVMKVWKCYYTDNIFSNLFNGQITNIYPDGFGVKVNNGEVVITEVQIEGKQKMSAVEFLNGIQDKSKFIGKVLD